MAIGQCHRIGLVWELPPLSRPVPHLFPGCDCGCLARAKYVRIVFQICSYVFHQTHFWKCLLPMKSRKLDKKIARKSSSIYVSFNIDLFCGPV